jgi:hypothetical protein
MWGKKNEVDDNCDEIEREDGRKKNTKINVYRIGI